MSLSIDGAKCQGHTRCLLISPTLFDVDDDGQGVVLDPSPGGTLIGEAERAVANCPEGAIRLS